MAATFHNKRSRLYALLVLVLTFPISIELCRADKISLDSTMKLERVLHSLHYPVGIVNAADGSNRLFIVQQGGKIIIVKDGSALPTPFLDVGHLLPESNNIPTGDESGLLSLVFHPDFASNKRFFIYYVDHKNDIRIAEYTVTDNPDVANPVPVQQILHINHPEDFKNHYGGSMIFVDGLLYIGVADGGGIGDPANNSQNKHVLLAKILRIDVDNPSNGKHYGIPSDNPFVNLPGKDEIYAYGVRNPWRLNYDAVTQRLFAGDVGQFLYEEVNIIEKGGNYGYHIMEGPRCYHHLGEPVPHCKKQGLILPIYSYTRHPFKFLTTAIILGPVYRGSALPQLEGKVLFADFTKGFIDTLSEAEDDTWVHNHLFKQTGIIFTSFGEDESGEVYMVNYAKKGSELYKLVPNS